MLADGQTAEAQRTGGLLCGVDEVPDNQGRIDGSVHTQQLPARAAARYFGPLGPHLLHFLAPPPPSGDPERLSLVTLEALGAFETSSGRKRTEHVFDLEELVPITTQAQIVSAPASLRDEARRLVDELSQTPGAMEEYLVHSAYDWLGAVRTSRSDRTRQYERAVLLQALSFGQVRPTVNPKISMITASRPGCSKKIFSDM